MRCRSFAVAALLPLVACFNEPDTIEEIAANLEVDLAKRGFDVAEGSWRLFPIEDCQYLVDSIGNCLANNPATPYIFPILPYWPDEFVDEAMQDVLGPTAEGTGPFWRLDEREALVILADMPPPARYFGLESYVWSRPGEIDTTDPIYQGLTDPFIRDILFMQSPNPERVLTFASVGESVNDAVIEEETGAAFRTRRYFVITADEGMERRMRSALLHAGVPDRDQVFVEPISTAVANVGLDEDADDLITLLRYSLPANEAAGEAWREELPLIVYRVRDTSGRPADPYPAPVRDERGGVSELDLQDDVADLIEAVKQEVADEAQQVGFESLLLEVDLVGEDCLARPMNCLGDNWDADYQISPTFAVDDGEIAAVVGTLGTATGNATYTNLAVNRLPELVGVQSINDEDLRGSAAKYAATVENTDKLYVYWFARDCGGLAPCAELDEGLIPPGDAVKIIQRNYVVPGTFRGVDPELVVNPTLVVFGAEYPINPPL